MNVKEAKELAPLASGYELRPDAKYLFVFDGYVDAENVARIRKRLDGAGLGNVILISGCDVKIIDLSPDA